MARARNLEARSLVCGRGNSPTELTMRISLPSPLLSACGVALLSAATALPLSAAAATATPQADVLPRIIAFGDSITEGVGFDDPDRTEFGYPPRLELLLAGEDLDYEVENHGKGGEDTTQGLTRLEEVLAAVKGAELLLLMEGTNDVAREVSLETTAFNLDEMARRAAERGIVTVHATVIPRLPNARKDPTNTLTRELNDLIRNLAFETGRTLCDQWNVFTAQPDYYDFYYYDGTDPVGHPNAAGFQLMAEGWLPKVKKARERPVVFVQAPAELEAGTPQTFRVTVEGTIVSARWEFGDGGLAWSTQGPDFAVDYLFLEPGTYEVKVVALDEFGRQSENRKTITILGEEAVSTTDQRSFLQSVLRGPRGNTGSYASSLWLRNDGEALGIAELSYHRRGASSGDDAPRRRVPLRPGETVFIADLLRDLFGESESTGSLAMKLRVPSAAGLAPRLSAFSNSYLALGEPEEGEFGQLVPEDPEVSWNAQAKQVTGVLNGNGFTATLLALNLDQRNGRVDVQLFDALGEPIGGTAALTLGPFNMRFQRLTQLFPEATGRSGPFTARFVSNGIRFAASATMLENTSEDQIFVPAKPAPPAGVVYVPRVAKGVGQFGTALSSRLALRNPSAEPTELVLELWLRGQENLTPPTAALTLAAGEARLVDDVVADLFALPEATGALRIDWQNAAGEPPLVHAYGFAVGGPEAGRFGMLVDRWDSEAAIAQRARVSGAAQTSFDKSSYGVINLSAASARVRVRVLDARGAELASTELPLRARQHLERNLAGIFPALGEGTNWTLETEVLSGGPILTYLARINVSGDVFFVPATSLPIDSPTP
jgi:lysophospholipase L1-like esterase/PKD repeat protein